MANRDNRPPRRWSLVASLGVLCLIVVGGTFVILTNPDDNGTRQASRTSHTSRPAQPPSTAASSPTATHASKKSCGVTDTRKRIPASTPDDVTWTLWKGGALPKSKSAGPLQVNKKTGVTSCYAHTPLGALMAAINIDFRALLATPDTTIVDKQVAPGPYKAQYRSFIASSSPPTYIPQVAGFNITSYQSSTALIKVALGNHSDGYIAESSTVIWQDGTWKSMASAGDTADSAERLDSLFGYVELKGVG